MEDVIIVFRLGIRELTMFYGPRLFVIFVIQSRPSKEGKEVGNDDSLYIHVGVESEEGIRKHRRGEASHVPPSD